MSDEPTRARYPDEEGYVERDGVRVFWERYGDGHPTVFLMPSWSFLPSRLWKAQIAYLARHFRVVVADGRGAGRSGRPTEPAAYAERVLAEDVLAVMDATGTHSAVLIGESIGVQRGLILAAEHPERVDGLVCFAPYLPLPLQALELVARRTFERRGTLRLVASALAGSAAVVLRRPRALFEAASWRLPRRGGFLRSLTLWNRHGMLRDWRKFAEWVSYVDFPEPHSTRQVEYGTEWRLDSAGTVHCPVDGGPDQRARAGARAVRPSGLPGARHQWRRRRLSPARDRQGLIRGAGRAAGVGRAIRQQSLHPRAR